MSVPQRHELAERSCQKQLQPRALSKCVKHNPTYPRDFRNFRAVYVLRRQELAERLKKEEALRIKQDVKARLDKDQEQRMRDELGR